MLAVAVISPDRATQDAVAEALQHHPNVKVFWTISEYPSPTELTRLREIDGSSAIVFLDYTEPIRAKSIAAELDRGYPTLSVVAMHPSPGRSELLELMLAGIREVMSLPLSAPEVLQAFNRANRRLNRDKDADMENSNIFAFLPARPGSGATTLAAHSAAAVARIGQLRTLLIDFDLRMGMTSFLFKLQGERCVLDALDLCSQGRLDDDLWRGLTNTRGPLEILGSASLDFSREQRTGSAAVLLNFVKSRYNTVCVDLPGEMLDHEVQTLHRAKEIFLVCTPEIGTLHMARKKAEACESLGVHSKVTVLLNRADEKNGMGTRAIAKDVEEILGLPVRFTLPSAGKEIALATQKATPIEGKSPLASQIERLALRMVPNMEALVQEKRPLRKFIDFFSVTPVREKSNWTR